MDNEKRSFLDKLLGVTRVDSRPKKAAEDAEREKFLQAIALNETSIIPEGERYSSFQDSGVPEFGRAMGKYRVTEGELNTYAPRYMGQAISPEQFLKDPKLQDQYLRMKYNYFRKQGYTPQQIADIHNKGVKNVSDDPNQFQSPDYVNKFNVTFNK